MKYSERVRGSILILILLFISVLGKAQCLVDPSYTFTQWCDSVEFINTSTDLTDIDSLHWDFGDNTNFVYIDTPLWNVPLFHIYTTTGDFKVTLTIFSEDIGGNPCDTSFSRTVSYYEPTAAFLTDQACFNELTTYTNNSTPVDSIISNQWFLDGALWSSNLNTEITFTQNGNYDIKLEVKNNKNCIDSITIPTIFELPKLGFITDTVCFGDATQFTDTSINASNISSYSWVYDEVEISTQQNFSYTFPVDGEMLEVKLYTTSNDPLGCEDSTSNFVKVAQIPTATFDSITGCLYDSLEFISLTEPEYDPIVSWLWDFDDAGTQSTNDTAYHTFSNTGLYNVNLTVTTDIGCIDDTTIAIIVDQPTAEFIHSDVCFGDTVLFDETSTATEYAELNSWFWDFGDGESTNSLGDTNHVYVLPNADPGYEVRLIVGSNLGCFDTTTNFVFVDTIPIAGFEFDLGCIGQEVCLYDTSYSGEINGSIINWEWTFDGDPIEAVQNPCFIFEGDTGWYHITLKVENDKGCWSDLLLDSIYLSHPPAAEFTVSGFCFDDTTFFTNITDTFGLEGTTWLWTFGEPYLGSADTSYLKNPWHIYTVEGDFEATLHVTSSYGCEDSISHPLTIDPLPDADFIIPDTVAIGATNIYYDNSTHPLNWPIYQWLWEFGDGGTSTNQDPSYAYSNLGLDTICLTVFSGCYGTICDTIMVVGCPNPEFYYVSDSLYQTSFYDQTDPSGNIISWYWDFGDNTTTNDTSTLQNPTWQYTASGWYQVYLRIEDKYGCEVDTIMNVYAGNSVLAEFSVFNLCQGDTTGFVDWSFSPVDSTYAYWHWNFGDGTDTTIYEKTDTIYHLYSLPFTYPVTLTVYDTVFGIPVQDSESKNITTFYDPEAEIDVSSIGVCLGVPIEFYDMSESEDVITTWTWDFGDGYFENTQNPIHEYDSTGAYNVILEVETLNGCTDTTDITVNMSFTPNVAFKIENPCINSGTQFIPDYGSDTLTITQWLWDFGDHLDTANTSVDSLPIHYYNRVDVYTVNAHMWSFDCKGEYQETFLVKPIPYSSFSLVENYQDVQGRTKFTNESIYATTYEWDFGNGNTTNVPDPIEIYELDSTYLISLAAINEYGCTDTSFYELEVFFKGLYFPNAFMPNGPNSDISLFTPKGVNLIEYVVQVYDLRGSLLWESDKLDENGSPVESWDGYYNDLLMPEGMYIWSASGVFQDGSVWKGQNFDNETIKTNGVVTLIR